MATYLKDIQESLNKIFSENENVILFGEDVLSPYGGAFKVTAGLSDKFPSRVFTTPISEASIVGMANGMAMRGLKPIVEIMFGDFLTLCTDQLVNHATKFNRMYNGKVNVPLLLRTPMGGGRGYGPTHSQSIEKMYLGVPFLKVIAPSIYHSPGSIMQNIIRKETQPVLFIEHKLLYSLELEKQFVTYDYELENFPTAIVTNYDAGAQIPDVTIISYGGVSRLIKGIMTEMNEEEIRIKVILPSSIKPLPMDAIIKGAQETGKIIIVEEGTSGFNWGSEVATVIYESCFNKLKSPIVRVASDEDIIPTASHLEDNMLVSAEKIRQAIFDIL